jgi:selenocysteine-specific elongation factor
VVRLYSPLITIGGGRAMLPNATLARNKTERAAKAEMLSALVEDFNPASLLAAIVHDRGVLSLSGLSELSQMDKNVCNDAVNELSRHSDTYRLIEFGKSRIFVSAMAFDTIAKAAQRILKKFHAENPELAGLDADKLYASLHAVPNAGKIAVGDFKDLTGMMAAKGIVAQVIVQGKTCYRAADFHQKLDDKFTAVVGRVREAVASAGFNLLTLVDLEEKLALSTAEIKRATAFLREQDDLRLLDGGFLFSLEMKSRLLAVLASMQQDITVASLRDSIGVSRKFTLPMLEFLDSQGLTQRIGDKRILIQNKN